MNSEKRFLSTKRVFVIIAAFICMLSVAMGSISAQACTAVYVGNEVSDDGTTLIAKSNDFSNVWGNYVTITQRVEGQEGRTMPVDNAGTVQAEIPSLTYRYTSTPWMDSTVAYNGLGKDAAICENECGVVMLMSITAFSNAKALKADPLVKNGITEFTAVDLVVCQSSTAREGVETLLGLIDRYGSSETNIAFIADQRETWYIEMYTGHQYAAVKLPDDRVCAFGNEFLLEYASDYEDSILSSNLESLAKDNEFAVYDGDKFNLLESYSGEEVATNYSHMRTWMTHKLLAPSKVEDYNKDEKYPLCFKPDKEVSLTDVMAIMRNRFEKTEYSPDKTKRTDMRVIGTETATSVHIAQIYPNLPDNMSCVTWESSGPALYGVFVPVSNGATSISEPYGKNQKAEDKQVFDESYPYYRFKALTTLASEPDRYKIYGKPVRAYWKEAEKGMTAGMGEVLQRAADMDDNEDACQYITDYCNSMQNQAFNDAGVLLNDVKWYLSKNSNTMKNGRNPETHEVLDELKKVKPLQVTLDPSVYQAVPEVPVHSAQEEIKEKANSNVVVYIVLGAAAVIIILGAVYIIFRMKKRSENG